MRGKVDPLDVFDFQTGITPAYAGKRTGQPERCRRLRDHPRLCGEKKLRHRQCLVYLGSPPPMRGKEQCRSLRTVSRGITPAYAGKSSAIFVPEKALEDHPRLCGEKKKRKLKVLLVKGSPPPMRGKGSSDRTVPCRCRITPAYAGKRLENAALQAVQTDHPRLCGEKGSGVMFLSVKVRITPAYAGKSAWCFCPLPLTRDHPRLCGEKQREHLKTLEKLGSPPPMRGKVSATRLVEHAGGITPAYAGKRDRGKNVPKGKRGSPPPMRGKGDFLRSC